MWDFDVLLSKSADGKDASNNTQVLEQWQKFTLVDSQIIDDLRLDNKNLYDKFPSGRVFLIGTDNPSLGSLCKKEWGDTWDVPLKNEWILWPYHVPHLGRRP